MNKIKKHISDKAVSILLAISILLFKTITGYIPAFQILNAAHYDIKCLLSDRISMLFDESIINFNEHQISLEIIASKIYDIVNDTPDYFDKYESTAILSKYGLKVIEKGSENTLLTQINSGWWTIAILDIQDAFKREFLPTEFDGDIRVKIYSEYILFDSNTSSLVFSHNRFNFQKYLDHMWNNGYKVINVIEYTYRWHEVHFLK